MTVVVFVGPTLPVADARPLLDATYLPPAARGDLYRAAREHPFAIGLIDGRFDSVPAVLHKEILWAMAQGVHVVGAASMGALRAAELDVFGMVGVGGVYEDYRRGLLTDDDEVAVVHGDADSGWAPLSESMVNVRASLDAAAAAGVITGATARVLTRIGKAMCYADRAFAALLAAGRASGVPHSELDAFRGWLPHGRVDRKRTDAVASLATLATLERSEPGPLRVPYPFPHTTFFRELTREAPPAADPTADETAEHPVSRTPTARARSGTRRS